MIGGTNTSMRLRKHWPGFLNEHPQIAKDYDALKLELWKKYEHNRDAYTGAKTDFIRKWTAEARKKYGIRY